MHHPGMYQAIHHPGIPYYIHPGYTLHPTSLTFHAGQRCSDVQRVARGRGAQGGRNVWVRASLASQDPKGVTVVMFSARRSFRLPGEN